MRVVEGLRPGQTVYDTQVVGFGVRRQAGPPVYVFRYRTKQGNRQRTYTIGRHGSPWTPEDARAEAIRLLHVVIDGGDPSGSRTFERKAISIGDLCVEYLAEVESGRVLTHRRVSKRPSTIVTDRSRIRCHIVPLVGHLSVNSISRSDIERMMTDIIEGESRQRVALNKRFGLSNVRGGRGAATRTIALFGAIMTYAIRRGLRDDNPCRLIVTPAVGRRERRLDAVEYRALGAALEAAEASGDRHPGLAVIRFLTTSGWRRGEVLGLRWTEIDMQRSTARLVATKTGPSTRPLSKIGCDIIAAMTQGEFVFRSTIKDAPMMHFGRVWERVAYRDAGLSRDITPHILRHSYASVAADLGYADATIGSLLGHRGQSITRRYIHFADSVLVSAADTVADRIVALMRGEAT